MNQCASSKEKKIAWKVLIRTHDNKLKSAGLGTQHRNALEYKENIENVPTIPGSGLFVFKSLEAARSFFPTVDLSSDQGKEIWKVEVRNPRRIKYRSVIYDNYVPMFWKLKLKKMRPKYISTVPAGTFICDSLVLLEKVR